MITIPFPLCHATSLIFENSIKEFGLGEINPIGSMRILAILRRLENWADKNIGYIWKIQQD